jgi:hypothetical protein
MERQPQSEDWCNCGVHTLDFLMFLEDHLDNAEMMTLLKLWGLWMRHGTDGEPMDEERATEEIIALLDSYFVVRIEPRPECHATFSRVMALVKEVSEEL